MNKVKVLFIQSYLTLCNPTDNSPPGSSALGISQASILEWVAIPFSKRSSQLRDQTQVSCTADRRFTIWATREALKQGKRTSQTLLTLPASMHSPVPFVITDELFMILLCEQLSFPSRLLTSQTPPSPQCHEWFAGDRYFKKKLFWPHFSPSCCPISSRPFTAKLLLKSCIYSQYPIHMLPFSMKPTLIRV